MAHTSSTIDTGFFQSVAASAIERWLAAILWAAVAALLFYQLGGAALFDPDEGRNSEKAREILALNDWVTPHKNFHPVLDKPMFFYWMIALSYKLFGVSEWAARFPSAVAALGCLIVVYFFARRHWGRWTALWSTLILLANVEFFALARIVILDMSLTLAVTLALCAFYEAAHTENARSRRILCGVMYLALGVAVLIKGLIGVVVPGMVIFFYLALGWRWKILKKIDLVPGALLVLAVALPWYLQAEARNPGYLRYFFWDEHFGRFTTNEFRRAGPWYYFFAVVAIGFLPWSVFLPLAVRKFWREGFDDKFLFLILWALLPFIFFSISQSKLPHYVLPIFPALAMLTAATVVGLYRKAESSMPLALSLAWLTQAMAVGYLVAGSLFPLILAEPIRDGVSQMPGFLRAWGAILVLGYIYLALRNDRSKNHGRLFLAQLAGLVLFFAFSVEVMILIAPERSAKPVAKTAMPLISPETQVVFYDTHLEGMVFYLRSEKPIWLITHENKKNTFWGNYYLSAKIARPISRFGDAIFTFDEFRKKWQTATSPFLIIVKEKNLARLVETVGEAPKTLAKVGEYLLVTKP